MEWLKLKTGPATTPLLLRPRSRRRDLASSLQHRPQHHCPSHHTRQLLLPPLLQLPPDAFFRIYIGRIHKDSTVLIPEHTTTKDGSSRRSLRTFLASMQAVITGNIFRRDLELYKRAKSDHRSYWVGCCFF